VREPVPDDTDATNVCTPALTAGYRWVWFTTLLLATFAGGSPAVPRSCLAFFEVPGKPFDFKRQDTLDLHIALGVEPNVFDRMLDKARTEGVEVRGPVDHGFCRSIYMRDPNGYVVELTASTGVQQEIMDPTVSKPREALARWQAAKPDQPGAAA
jgi:catechol 2,3-dioxygenase-like lactoylglutathione lyase family enzyme